MEEKTKQRAILAHYKDKLFLQTFLQDMYKENGISIIDDFAPTIEKA